MQIMPINSIKTQNTQFKAKFSKQDVNHFLKEIEDNDVDIVSKLYTMLDYVKTLPGKEIKILASDYRPWYQIQIDGVSATQGRYYISAYHALKDITVSHKNTALKNTNFARMTQDKFQNAAYKNNSKTIQDIENIFKD